MSTSINLANRHCRPPEGKSLDDAQADALLAQIEGWQRESGALTRTFCFKNYYETIAFVNATAYVSHHEDHHPDLLVRYNRCVMTYTTHDVGGLSENDFICAAKINALYAR